MKCKQVNTVRYILCWIIMCKFLSLRGISVLSIVTLISALLAIFNSQTSGTRITVDAPMGLHYATRPLPAGNYTVIIDIYITLADALLMIMPESAFIRYMTGQGDYTYYHIFRTNGTDRIYKKYPHVNYPEQFRYFYTGTNREGRGYAVGYMDFVKSEWKEKPIVVLQPNESEPLIQFLIIVTGVFLGIVIVRYLPDYVRRNRQDY